MGWRAAVVGAIVAGALVAAEVRSEAWSAMEGAGGATQVGGEWGDTPALVGLTPDAACAQHDGMEPPTDGQTPGDGADTLTDRQPAGGGGETPTDRQLRTRSRWPSPGCCPSPLAPTWLQLESSQRLRPRRRRSVCLHRRRRWSRRPPKP